MGTDKTDPLKQNPKSPGLLLSVLVVKSVVKYLQIRVYPCPPRFHCGQNPSKVFSHGFHGCTRIRSILQNQNPSLPLIRAGREIRGQNSSRVSHHRSHRQPPTNPDSTKQKPKSSSYQCWSRDLTKDWK